MNYYFIDSENVGDDWISLLGTINPEDVIHVFYTSKSPNMKYKNIIILKNSTDNIEFIECFEGNNALDFQLSTHLGYLICEKPDNNYIIVSNDTGYDAIVKYWKKRSKSVLRIPGKKCETHVSSTKPLVKPNISDTSVITVPDLPKPSDISEPAAPSLSNKVVQESEVDSSAEEFIFDDNPKDSISDQELFEIFDGPFADASDSSLIEVPFKDETTNTDSSVEEKAVIENIDDNAREILYIIGKNNLPLLHEALVKIYGDKRGKHTYNAFKKDNSFNNFLKNHKKLSAADKQKKYLSIVFSTHDIKNVPSDLANFSITTWNKKKNLNSFRSSLQTKYGKEKTNTYYTILRDHIKILDKIK